MLFVDDDQPEIGKRQEESRTSPHHDARFAGRHRAPGLAPPRAGDFRMPMQRRRPEPVFEAPEPIHRECDLGQQHEHLTAARQRSGHRFEIDLGLARAGDPVEQRHLAGGAGGDLSPQTRRGTLLRRGKRGAPPPPVRPRDFHRRFDRDRPHQAVTDKAAHHARAGPRRARDLGRLAGTAVGEKIEDAFAGVGQAHPVRRLGPGDNIGRFDPWRVERFRHAHRHAQHRAGRGHRVGGGPGDGLQEVGREGRNLKHGGHIAQLRLFDIALGLAPNDTGHLANAERHPDEPPGRDIHTLGDPVVVSAGDRQGDQDRGSIRDDSRGCPDKPGRHELHFNPSLRGVHAALPARKGTV